MSLHDPILDGAHLPIPPADLAAACARLASCDGTPEEVAEVIAMVSGGAL